MFDERVKHNFRFRSESFSAFDALQFLLVRVVEFVFELLFNFAEKFDRVNFQRRHRGASRSSRSWKRRIVRFHVNIQRCSVKECLWAQFASEYFLVRDFGRQHRVFSDKRCSFRVWSRGRERETSCFASWGGIW